MPWVEGQVGTDRVAQCGRFESCGRQLSLRGLLAKRENGAIGVGGYTDERKEEGTGKQEEVDTSKSKLAGNFLSQNYMMTMLFFSPAWGRKNYPVFEFNSIGKRTMY